MTLPVILALAEGTAGERETITTALGDADATAEQVTEVVAIMNRYRTLGRTMEQAQSHARAAQDALGVLPPSEMRTLLSDVVEYSVSRAF